MIIGIDVSQLAYENTGVANYLQNLVQNLINTDKKNKYVLFYTSLRKNLGSSILNLESNSNTSIKKYRVPPIVLDFLWNRLHILPIESFIGKVDVFITSDWTEPPAKKAKKATILYDLIVFRYPNETHKKIVDVQKRKLNWVKKETNMIFCISESTKKDAQEILGLPENRLSVLYPGL